MWKYKNKNVLEAPIDSFGFVYIISFKDKSYYIGCKQFYSNRNVRLSKKKSNELYSGKGRKPLKEKIVKESNWKTYTSSSKIVNERLTKEKGTFEILSIHNNKNEMNINESYFILQGFIKNKTFLLNEWVSIKCSKPK